MFVIHLHRLIIGLVIWLLLLCSGTSHAVMSCPVGHKLMYPTNYGTFLPSCTDSGRSYVVDTLGVKYAYGVVDPTSSYCQLFIVEREYVGSDSSGPIYKWSEPRRSLTGYNAVCRPASCADQKGDTVFEDSQYIEVSGRALSFCHKGCKIDYDWVFGRDDKSTGKSVWNAAGPFTHSGQDCVPSDGLPTPKMDDTNGDGVPDTERPSPCPTGSCPGFVNGISKCYPCTTSEGKSSSTTKQSSSAASSPSSGASSPSGAASAEVKETKDVKCEGGKCTTTTTKETKNADGSTSTSTEKKEQSKSDFCKENPTLKICAADDSSWGGDCSHGFVCTGDVIQCAQAKAAWTLHCDLTDYGSNDNDPTFLRGKQSTSSSSSSSGSGLFGLPSFSYDLRSYITGNSSIAPSAGGCLPDKTIIILNKSLTIPYSRYCSIFEILAYGGNAVTLLFSLFYLFKDKIS